MSKIAIVMPEGLSEEEQEAYRKQMEPIIEALREAHDIESVDQTSLEALVGDLSQDDPDADLFDETLNDEVELAPYFAVNRMAYRELMANGDSSVLH